MMNTLRKTVTASELGDQVEEQTFDSHDFVNESLRGITFHKCSFVGANLESVQAVDCTFEDCDFSMANFTRAKLERCVFKSGVCFRYACLRDAIFVDVSVIGGEADFEHVLADRLSLKACQVRQHILAYAASFTITCSVESSRIPFRRIARRVL